MTLEEIYKQEAEPYPLDMDIVMECMRLAYNQALEDAAQVAVYKDRPDIQLIHKQSILKLKKQ